MSMDATKDLLASHHNSDLYWLFTTSLPTPIVTTRTIFEHEDVLELLCRNPEVRLQMQKILDEMAHTWSPTGIRIAGIIVTKILRQVCSSLLVDQEVRISRNSFLFSGHDEQSAKTTINRLLVEAPVLYLPSHRSYADFIIISYVCFSMGLPLPSIAAGTDFLSLNQVASLLRSCGAFFIRRSSLKNDPLYWTTFKAYVEQQIIGRERPIEFFIEGRRSRSGKSLLPKTGLLSIAVNLFLSGRITDLILMPICVSYDRLMEENLYAKEISPGSDGSKPNETTDHLLTGTRKVLSQNYGSIHVRFSEPISVRQVSTHFHGLDVRRHTEKDSNLVSRLVNEIALNVVRHQVNGTVLSAFDLFSFVIVAQHANQSASHSDDELTVSFSQVVQSSNQLLELIPSQQTCNLTEHSIAAEMSACISQVHAGKFVRICNDQLVLKWDVLSRSTLRLYANKLLQLLIDHAVCVHVHTIEDFVLSKHLLAGEFCPSATHDLEDQFTRSRHLVSHISSDVRSLLSPYFIFYLRSYLRICVWLLHVCDRGDVADECLIKRAAGELSLTTDLLSNFWLMMRQRVADSSAHAISRSVLRRMKEEIAQQLSNCDIDGDDENSVKAML